MPRFEILWINLDCDAERRAWMEPQLRALGLPARRVPGLRSSTLPPWIEERFLPDAGEILLPNNIGSFASHLLVASQVACSGLDAAVVLEDDVEILCSADELTRFVQSAAECDIVKLNDWPKSATVALARLPHHTLVRFLRVPRGNGSYVLTRAGANRLLDRAHRLAISTDNFIRAEGSLALRIGGIVPPPIPQDRLPGSVLDPTGARDKARNRRYFYRPPGGAGLAPRVRFLAGELGWRLLVRLLLRELAMRLRRVKRDTGAAYRVEG